MSIAWLCLLVPLHVVVETISGATDLSTNVPDAVRAGSGGNDCTVALYECCLKALHFTACKLQQLRAFENILYPLQLHPCPFQWYDNSETSLLPWALL